VRVETVRNWLKGLRLTPLHPQWIAYRCDARRLRQVAALAEGIVLDVGCADRRLSTRLRQSCTYLGLDNLQVGGSLYGARPDVTGDAHALPFRDDCVDTVVLMEVAEHLLDPNSALQEAKRVVNPGGRIILTTPFMYPTHDAPHDYRRWTRHGLEAIASANGFSIGSISTYGAPSEVGALLFNLGLSFQAVEGLEGRDPLGLLLLPALTLLAPLANILGWLARSMGRPRENPMPLGFMMLLTVPEHESP